MKITKKQLEKIIKEEVTKALNSRLNEQLLPDPIVIKFGSKIGALATGAQSMETWEKLKPTFPLLRKLGIKIARSPGGDAAKLSGSKAAFEEAVDVLDDAEEDFYEQSVILHKLWSQAAWNL